MWLKSLYLRNFRNYADLEIAFSQGLNVLHGENAQGKTNLLEAIYLVSTGQSFRTTQLGELVRQGESFFFLEAILEKEGMEHQLQIHFDGKAKKLTLDGNGYASFQPLLGLLPSVLSTPADGELIEGAPHVRRRFLNLHLAQKNPLYIHHLARYWRAMKQRNLLLKTKESASLNAWEVEMSLSAIYLQQARKELIDALQKPLQEKSEVLSSLQEGHSLQFHPSGPPTQEGYLSQLRRHRTREQLLGFTLTGPHRDDFSIQIDGKLAKTFASEGQKKTSLAALKLAEWELLCQSTQTRALFGLDDLGVHLDAKRGNTLRGAIGSLAQVFITTPEPIEEGTPFLIAKGSVNRAQVSLS